MFGIGAKDHPVMRDVPIGLDASGTRREFDSMGEVDVPADRYWGAQTARSLVHFSIGDDRMRKAVYHAYGIVKKACALVNQAEGRLPDWKAEAIVRAADETIAGELDEHFPLYVWQTGSGTQSNMNVNEVLSNRAIQLLGGTLGSSSRSAPTTTSTWGSPPTTRSRPPCTSPRSRRSTTDCVPARRAGDGDRGQGEGWMDVVKIGRTHLEDATPLTVGQEWSGWAAQLRARDRRRSTQPRAGLYELAVGGTAVGTGLNAPKGFS